MKYNGWHVSDILALKRYFQFFVCENNDSLFPILWKITFPSKNLLGIFTKLNSFK